MNNILINIIVKYSLINNTTNPTPLYSVIKPLTNSEGLSTKSKGRRFLSANNITKTKLNKGNKIINPIYNKFNIKYFNLILFRKKMINKRKNLKQSS